MKRISLFCLAVAIINSLLIALDSGQFYQTQLYSDSFSYLQLGFVTSLLIECMIGLLFALAFSADKTTTKVSLLFLGSLILILSFVSSSARHILPKVDEIVEINNRQKLAVALNTELMRGQNTENWLRQKNQKLNAIIHERNQKALFDDYVSNLKNQKSSIVPILIVILITALKFLMQITAAIFFALSGHYSSLDMLLKEMSNEQHRGSVKPTSHIPNSNVREEELDLNAMKEKANLNNRTIAEALGLKECVVSNALNKSGEIYTFLKSKINNSIQ
jgi:hypothetical protein